MLSDKSRSDGQKSIRLVWSDERIYAGNGLKAPITADAAGPNIVKQDHIIIRVITITHSEELLNFLVIRLLIIFVIIDTVLRKLNILVVLILNLIKPQKWVIVTESTTQSHAILNDRRVIATVWPKPYYDSVRTIFSIQHVSNDRWPASRQQGFIH